MSDLISRLSLKDRASEYALSADEYKRLCKIIDTEPTAYDIDKVVEELELHSFELGTDTLPVHYVRLNDAIEIVKAGGKNEKEEMNIMEHNSIEKQKQAAKNTNELLNHLIKIIEQNNKRFSFEWAVGGEHATMEIFDNEKEIGYVVNIEPIRYDETGKAINI